MKKKIVVLFSLAVIIYLVYNYIYKEHRDIANEKPSVEIASLQIFKDFSLNSTNADAEYLNKTIQITGTITELNKTNLTLDDKVFCDFEHDLNALKLKAKIVIKGRCIGFDDLLEQVKLDQCNIIK